MSRRLRGEDGALVLWFLGLCLLLLTVAGLGIDLWRGFSERRALVGIADAAAFAGASGIDEEHFRATGTVRLEPARARSLARRSLAGQSDDRSLVDAAVTVDPAGSAVTVVVAGEVPLTVLRLITLEPLRVTAVATSQPQLGG